MDLSDLIVPAFGLPGRRRRGEAPSPPPGGPSDATRVAAVLAGGLVLPALLLLKVSWRLASDTDAMLSIVTGPVGILGVCIAVYAGGLALLLAVALWRRRPGARVQALLLAGVAVASGLAWLVGVGSEGSWAVLVGLLAVGYGGGLGVLLLRAGVKADFPVG